MENIKLISYSYDVTLTFTLLAVLNLISWRGSLPYRMVTVLMNVVVGASMEYLVNRYSVTKRKTYLKGLVALILLVTNIVWIVVTLFN
ncbi:Putative uncharacterized protein [Lactobacillus hominis DSM 23910 = CRBIP 24.179]|uniref:Uncharacterized protein n=1 Tax=Lactobacillus hominis DSM 23910 = CRBIP 24.179 TaxID=1423758 RepID=I7L7C0_9LACO|nr:hypothetical protein [Lactobacillus hominis]CCI82532.1 Putative uncharacterized protein [Lactobacillus hominis DSM 23910 = CRBIP 24.179]